MIIFDLISVALILGFGYCLVAAAVSDARHYIIPNRLTVSIVALWLLYIIVDRLAPNGGEVAVLWHSIVALVVFLIFFAAFALGRMGGGDVKLIAATALWVGPEGIAPFLILTSIAGLFVTAAKLFLGKRSEPTRTGPIESETSPNPDNAEPSEKPSREIPYGIAIAVGGLFVAGQLIVNRFT